jgi:virginiamycin B lyase
MHVASAPVRLHVAVAAILAVAFVLALVTLGDPPRAAAASFPHVDEFSLNGTGPIGITSRPDGTLWFAENTGVNGSDAIGRVSLGGRVKEISLRTSGTGPYGIAAGSDGNLWLTENRVNRVVRVTPSGATRRFAAPTGGLNEIAAGPDGALWFPEPGVGISDTKIARITTAGAITEFSLPQEPDPTTGSPLSMSPETIHLGPGGVWFDDATTARVGRIDTAGHITTFGPTPSLWSSGLGITKGPDGNIWFTEGQDNTLIKGRIGRLIPSSGQITEFPVLNGMFFGGIAAGSDGALWFTGSTGNIGWLGRMTLSGQVTLHELPQVFSMPAGIVAGRDGNMWFTDTNANTVGRIDLKRHNGTIIGAILHSAGAIKPGKHSPQPQPGTVTLGNATVSRTETVKRGHRYRFTLPAGRYRLSAKSGGCTVSKNVQVVAGQTRTVNIVCNVS